MGDAQHDDDFAATTPESESDPCRSWTCPKTSTTTIPTTSEIDDEYRTDRDYQNSGAGGDRSMKPCLHIQCNTGATNALATPNSSAVPADQLQGFIDSVTIDTNYCVRAKVLPEDVYLVNLSELRPESAERATQTVTTKKIDGKWFVDVFT